MHGDGDGRVPFAFVAVFLLLSSGLAALYAAKLNGDEADRQVEEARLDALARVAEAVHEEVTGQAQQVALRAIVSGTQGVVNETRISEGFREGFRDYVRAHFPRVVRTIRVDVPEYAADISLLLSRTEDAVPSNATREQLVGGGTEVVTNDSAPDAWAEVERVAYHLVAGWVNYTLSMDGVTATRSLPLRVAANAPVPFMAAKLEETAHLGLGDFAGIGRVVKSVLTTLVQFRVLSGWASPMAEPGTETTSDILTTADVELALNLGLLLEEVRQFRTFDRDAANAVDAARAALPGLPAAAASRGLVHMLETYAANGTVDAVDLYAIYTGLDARGIRMASVLAQAIAGIRDQLELKALDYFGLMPLADFFNGAVQWAGEMFDGFLRWLGGQPSRRAEYVRGYVKAVFVDTGVGTGFLGPQEASLPERTYAIGSVNITVPAQAYEVAFPTRDLLASGYNEFWDAYYERLNASLGTVGTSLHALASEFAANVGQLLVVAGWLNESASGPIDPKDVTSLMAMLGGRILRAVDEAVDRIVNDPGLIDALTSRLGESLRATLRALVDHVVASYDGLAGREVVLPAAQGLMATDLAAQAARDPDYAALDASGVESLKTLIRADVAQWVPAAYEARKASDLAHWRDAAIRANAESFRAAMRAVIAGSGGWLILARAMLQRTIQDDIAALDTASLRAVVPTRTDPFVLTDPADPSRARTESFRIRQTPAYLRDPWAGPPGVRRTGDLWIEVTDPADVPVAETSPNVHYTDPTSFSFHPYVTTWSVRVAGVVHLRVETACGAVVGPDGLEPVALEGDVPLHFGFSIAASSGWGLTGVTYQTSNSLWHDLVALGTWFLEKMWSVFSELLRPVLDAFRRVARVLLELVEPIARFANDVVRLLSQVAVGVVDFLRGIVWGVVDALGRVIDVFAAIPRLADRFHVRVGGLAIDVSIDPEPGTRFLASVRAGALDLWLRLVNLPEAGHAAAGRPTWDVLSGWRVDLAPFRLSASLDPVMVEQETGLAGTASWEDSWALELAGPKVDNLLYFGRSWTFPGIASSAGLAELVVGIRVLVPSDPGGLIQDVIAKSYEEAIAEVGGEPRSLEALVGFLGAYARRVIANAEDAFDRSFQAQLFVQGGVAGKGFALAFVAEGRAVRELLTWVARNAMAFARSGWNPLAPAEYEGLPPAVMENLWIWGDVQFSVGVPSMLTGLAHVLGTEVRAAATIRANVAAIGVLLGRSWGAWAVEFGAFLEVSVAKLEVLDFFSAGDIEAFWLLWGSLHAY